MTTSHFSNEPMIVRHDGSNWLAYHPRHGVTKSKTKKDYGLYKDLFEDYYKKAIDHLGNSNGFLRRKQLDAASAYIYNQMSQDYDVTKKEVADNVAREYAKFLARHQTLKRKVFNNPFNYFISLTYDSKKWASEDDFIKAAKTCLNHLSDRRGWRYFGKKEKGDLYERTHLHIVAYIPEGQMVGDLKKVPNRNRKKGIWQITTVNSFFDERFGWNEFEPVDQIKLREGGFKYLTKYMSKNNEKFIYGRGVLTSYEIPEGVLTAEDFERYSEDEFAIVYRYQGYLVLKSDSFICDPFTASLFNEDVYEEYREYG